MGETWHDASRPTPPPPDTINVAIRSYMAIRHGYGYDYGYDYGYGYGIMTARSTTRHGDIETGTDDPPELPA